MTTPSTFKRRGLLSTGDIARRKNVHRTTVWHWIRSGLLKSTRVTPRFRGVSEEDLAAFEANFISDSPPPSVSRKKASTSGKRKTKKAAKKSAA